MRVQIHNKLDLNEYLGKIDLNRVPGKEEIDAALEKRLTRAHITLKDLAVGEPVQPGDAVVLRTKSVLPKFNKAKVPVTVGAGLYDKELENALAGKAVGTGGELMRDGASIQYTILSAQRKEIPVMTDAMAAEQGVDGADTVEKFRAHLADEMVGFVTLRIAFEIGQALVEAADVDDLSEEELDRLEYQQFLNAVRHPSREVEVDTDSMPQEELQAKIEAAKEAWCAEHEETMEQRREVYKIIVKRCLAFGNALGIPLEGEYDPMENPNAVVVLMQALINRVTEDIKGRKDY